MHRGPQAAKSVRTMPTASVRAGRVGIVTRAATQVVIPVVPVDAIATVVVSVPIHRDGVLTRVTHRSVVRLSRALAQAITPHRRRMRVNRGVITGMADLVSSGPISDAREILALVVDRADVRAAVRVRVRRRLSAALSRLVRVADALPE